MDRITDKTDVLIVGGGQSGAYSAIALRNQEFLGSITVVGEEAGLPYERPPLSKEYFNGEKPFERLLIRPEKFWKEKEISLMSNEVVVSIDPVNHIAITDKESRINYKKCIWAAGGKPRNLNCPGADLPGIYSFKTREDADQILHDLERVEHVVIVGGGYIGLESASALIKKGKQVTLLEAGPRLLARVAGKTVSNYLDQLHRAKGVDIRIGVNLDRFIGKDRVAAVRLADGEEIPCEMVIVGIGIIPCVSPLTVAGAKGENGVEVNAQGETSLQDIYAIGDCALHHNLFANGLAVRLESVQNANDQALIVAQNIVGKRTSYESIPWFWSNQYDIRLQTAGLSIGYEKEVLDGNPEGHSFSVLYLLDGHVVAIDCINSPKDFIKWKKLIHQKSNNFEEYLDSLKKNENIL